MLGIIKNNRGNWMSHLVSECCSSPPMTDVHDGIGICDECREWSGFYDEESRESGEWREPINFKGSDDG